MRRASSPVRGETRPQKRICPPRTYSPHSDLSHPPLEVWCAESPSSFFFGLAVGGRVGLSPSTVRPSATSGPRVRRNNRFSFIPNKDAGGFPSWWRASLLPGLVDTPSQVCLPQHDTLIPLSHFIHEWEHLPGESLWVLSKYLPQVARPHGSGLPCVAPRVASHEAVPLVDERAEIFTPRYLSLA